MAKQKLIFFDIDGTLLDEEKHLPASAEAAIAELKEAGHHVVIATGRAPFMFSKLQQRLSIDSFISFNGSYVEYEREAVYKKALDPGELQRFTTHAAQNDHPLVYLDHLDMRANVPFHPHIKESIGSLKFEHPEVDPSYLENRNIYQTLLFCKKEEEHPYYQNFPEFDFIRWHEVSSDVLPAGGSKAIGIEVIMNKLSLTKEDVYVFGDGPNDVEMLSFTDNSVAMGNAVPEAKAAASIETAHVAEDGLVKALRKFALIK